MPVQVEGAGQRLDDARSQRSRIVRLRHAALVLRAYFRRNSGSPAFPRS